MWLMALLSMKLFSIIILTVTFILLLNFYFIIKSKKKFGMNVTVFSIHEGECELSVFLRRRYEFDTLILIKNVKY